MKTIEVLVDGQVMASVAASRWELVLNHILNYVSLYEETDEVSLRVFNSFDEADSPAAFSDNDFVKWQEDRQNFLSEISTLQGEVRYWQSQAMRSGNRD